MRWKDTWRRDLYTGTAIVGGSDSFRELAEPMCRASGATLEYAELDPDVFGSELPEAPYAGADRLAAVGLVTVLPDRS